MPNSIFFQWRAGFESKSVTDTRATTDKNDPFLNMGFKHGKKWVDKNGFGRVTNNTFCCAMVLDTNLRNDVSHHDASEVQSSGQFELTTTPLLVLMPWPRAQQLGTTPRRLVHPPKLLDLLDAIRKSAHTRCAVFSCVDGGVYRARVIGKSFAQWTAL